MRTLILILVLTQSLPTAAQRFQVDELDELKRFTSLEEALLKPDSVFRLRLRGRLREIPKEVFTSFRHLHELDLSKNRLKSLPPDIRLLKKLKRLGFFSQIDAIGFIIIRLPMRLVPVKLRKKLYHSLLRNS